jgi:hypothetical protein
MTAIDAYYILSMMDYTPKLYAARRQCKQFQVIDRQTDWSKLALPDLRTRLTN